MKLIYQNHDFHYPSLGSTGVCQIQIYRDALEQNAVVLIIEDERNARNTSVTNSSQEIRRTLHILGLIRNRDHVRYVEILDNEFRTRPEFDLVIFDSPEHHHWRPSSRAEIEQMIGQSIPGIRAGDARLRH